MQGRLLRTRGCRKLEHQLNGRTRRLQICFMFYIQNTTNISCIVIVFANDFRVIYHFRVFH